MATSTIVLLIIDFITYTFKVKECEKRLTTQMNDVKRADKNPFDEFFAEQENQQGNNQKAQRAIYKLTNRHNVFLTQIYVSYFHARV